MEKESLQNLTLPELCDLLVTNTVLLLDSMDKNADGVTLRDLKNKVELLQRMITDRRVGIKT